MSKRGRKKNLKNEILVESPKIPEKSTKILHQTEIANYCLKASENETVSERLGLPEGSLPSPDDAALPCSTSLCSDAPKSLKDKVIVDETVLSNETVVQGKERQKISDMTNKVIKEIPKKKKKKKQTEQLRNSKLTEFFPVRRSYRITLPNVKKEKQKTIEDAILSGKEDGFEIKEFPDKGRGIVTKKAIQRGEYVMEYCGELIEYDEALQRESDYGVKEGCYMYYFCHLNKRYCIDATKESGRLGRLINHSKKGNLKTQPFIMDNSPHLVFLACRDIEPGEELGYDYGDRRKEVLECFPWLAQ